MHTQIKNTGVLNARQLNILRSPKKGGSADIDALPYARELGIEIVEKKQPIQFSPNINEHIHRWAPYVQGFSASFVQSIIDQYRDDYENPVILDPFAGCGTVLVEAKLNGLKSIGTELNPLLQYIANTKLNCWDITPNYLLKTYNELPQNKRTSAPSFLKSNVHFNAGVLKNLEIIKGSIDSIKTGNSRKRKTKNLLLLAFSSILIDCSNLKRSPCLGYCKNKKVDDSAPLVLMNQKVHEIADDLKIIHSQYKDFIDVESNIVLTNAMEYKHDNNFEGLLQDEWVEHSA